MPELPDVEWAARQLRAWLRGAVVRSARSTDRRVLRPTSPAAFGRALSGRRVRGVSRRGKWLRIELDDGHRLFSHLGMTGSWVERDAGAGPERHERARIDVARDDGRRSSLRYVDARRLGRLVLAREDIPEWRALGPDPLADGVDARSLAVPLGRSRRAVKDMLLDQSVLAGVGNVLATEALWAAGIDPRSRSDALSRRDVAKIVRGLRAAIERDLARDRPGCGAEGASPEGAHSAYGRAGQPCPRCGAPLVRQMLAGRSTTFCPRCQVRRT